MFRKSAQLFFKKTNFKFSDVKSLVLIEHSQGKISIPSLSTLNAAKQLGGEITALVTGVESDCENVGKYVSKMEGINKIILYSNESLKNFIGENVSKAILSIQKKENYTHILSNHSAFGKNILPRLGANLDVQPISDVMTINSPSNFVRPIYAGNALCEIGKIKKKNF